MVGDMETFAFPTRLSALYLFGQSFRGKVGMVITLDKAGGLEECRLGRSFLCGGKGKHDVIQGKKVMVWGRRFRDASGKESLYDVEYFCRAERETYTRKPLSLKRNFCSNS
jgi:hypothetical protein